MNISQKLLQRVIDVAEDAYNQGYNKGYNDGFKDDRKDILDTIRVEIERIEINGYIRDVECFTAGINTALNIIDKYRKGAIRNESETSKKNEKRNKPWNT